ncbi:hypothetical protein FKZ61_015425 [Litorilinea aerophila]|uniref:Uncharacterized protein n=1 Tax=Litorilinea aerophila TaxID=1204385 RepID=A0A540VDH4_9CHLR|nr:hypothetical protein [Litorilinea aerophila]MCC9077491.1 hypothetical protein [Litorilinea aerophila]OUC07154.1 hypothetical protein RY27_16635 [Litorilinea aerophila]
MLTPGAIYRFKRTNELRYYRAARTPSGVDFLYPISVNGSRIADRHPSGRRYVLLYFMTRWGKFAVGGYWLDPRKMFERAYVTDATPQDLELVTEDLADLPAVDAELDNILNRADIELDMEVWGSLLEP